MTIETTARAEPKYVCPEGHAVPYEEWNYARIFLMDSLMRTVDRCLSQDCGVLCAGERMGWVSW